jgi:hypothetical protein
MPISRFKDLTDVTELHRLMNLLDDFIVKLSFKADTLTYYAKGDGEVVLDHTLDRIPVYVLCKLGALVTVSDEQRVRWSKTRVVFTVSGVPAGGSNLVVEVF